MKLNLKKYNITCLLLILFVLMYLVHGNTENMKNSNQAITTKKLLHNNHNNNNNNNKYILPSSTSTSLSSSSSSDSKLNSFASRMRQKLVHHFKQRLHHLKDNDKLNSNNIKQLKEDFITKYSTLLIEYSGSIGQSMGRKKKSEDCIKMENRYDSHCRSMQGPGSFMDDISHRV